MSDQDIIDALQYIMESLVITDDQEPDEAKARIIKLLDQTHIG